VTRAADRILGKQPGAPDPYATRQYGTSAAEAQAAAAAAASVPRASAPRDATGVPVAGGARPSGSASGTTGPSGGSINLTTGGALP
jgi:hypothetical protein